MEFGRTARLSKRPDSMWNCLWGQALKDLLGSVVRVGYRISVPHLYLVLHGLCCTIMDQSINQSAVVTGSTEEKYKIQQAETDNVNAIGGQMRY